MNVQHGYAKLCAESLFVSALLAGTALSQTSFVEIEPNSTKAEATLAAGLVAGDTLNGTTTGFAVTPGLGTDATADTWRVKTAAMPLGIYRHTLVITTASGGGHAATIRGVNQVTGVPGTIDTILQTASAATAVPRSNTWYAFGKQEEIHWRVAGVPSTGAPYVATLSTIPITPLVVAGTFNPGQVVITTYLQGHGTDTEIYLYDANLDPVPLGHNDGTATSGIANSILTMQNLPAGIYYVAVGEYNTANNLSDLNPDDPYTSDPLLDFPNAMSSSRVSTNLDMTFTVTDGVNSTQQPCTKVNAFDVVWARIQVGNPATPTTPYCFGDGTGTACPCANSGAAGNGCASSVNALGGNLGATGIASLANDTFSLLGSNMPNSSALYFQGTAQTAGGAGSVLGDGLRCASGTVIRLGTKTNAGGSSSYPAAGDVAISIKGANSAGAVRDYQVWYRNAATFCSPSTFNLTNGIAITWGA